MSTSDFVGSCFTMFPTNIVASIVTKASPTPPVKQVWIVTFQAYLRRKSWGLLELRVIVYEWKLFNISTGAFESTVHFHVKPLFYFKCLHKTTK